MLDIRSLFGLSHFPLFLPFLLKMVCSFFTGQTNPALVFNLIAPQASIMSMECCSSFLYYNNAMLQRSTIHFVLEMGLPLDPVGTLLSTWEIPHFGTYLSTWMVTSSNMALNTGSCEAVACILRIYGPGYPRDGLPHPPTY